MQKKRIITRGQLQKNRPLVSEEDFDMARQPRQKAASGIYHIILRGINRQIIFEDEEDFSKYKSLLSFYKRRCGFELYGYCLMDNHIHLLVKEAANAAVLDIGGSEIEIPPESLESIFKRIGVSYVLYFNRKYKRVGHLFQDRFKSEPIETLPYLMMALRYIHRNPIKAGICEKAEEYSQSSYRDYIGEEKDPITDVSLILDLTEIDDLIQFTAEENQDSFIDVAEQNDFPKTDQEAKELLAEITGCTSASAFQELSRQERDEAFRRLKKDGVSITQISRITGVSRPLIYRAINED